VDLGQFLSLAADAGELRRAGHAVGLFGETGAALDFLRVLFALLPPHLRLLCTFDTLFVGASVNRLPCWAVGLPAGHPPQPSLLTFDLSRRRFTPDPPRQPVTSLARWIASRRNDSARGWGRDLAAAGTLHEWLRGRRPAPPWGEVDEELFRTLAGGSPELLRRRLHDQLRRDLGDGLAGLQTVARMASVYVGDDRNKAFLCLTQGYPRAKLGRWVALHYGEKAVAKPPDEEMEGLRALLERLEDGPARGEVERMYLRWGGRWQELADRLRQAQDKAFHGFLRWALQTADPVEVYWRVYHYEDRTAFGLFIDCGRQADKVALFDALLGARPGDLFDRTEAGRELPRPVDTGRWLRLIEVFASGIARGRAGLQALRDDASVNPQKLRGGEVLLRQAKWDGLRRFLDGQDEAVFKALAASALERRRGVALRWLAVHDQGGVFFGPCLVEPKNAADARKLLWALLDVPEKLRRGPPPAQRGETDRPTAEPDGRRWPLVAEQLSHRISAADGDG
jgi:hypothetical protein